MPKTVAIVGAGVGGLATAARLAHKGYEVTVYEKLAHSGGRNNMLEDCAFKFDMGPSFVLMPDLFEELFRYCQKDIKDYLTLLALDPGYKIFYPDGTSFTVYKDSQRTAQEMERLEKGSSEAFERLIKEISKIYTQVKPLLYHCFSPLALGNPRYWPLITRLKTFQSYWDFTKRFFKSDKLCYAFTFEAMFVGVSPFETPAFYSIITYADHVQKIYHPLGGMYQIPRAIEKLATDAGARLRYNCAINRIRKCRGTFLLSCDQGSFESDAVVVNADYAYTQTDLLGRKIPHFKYSCSVYLMYLGLKKKLTGLAHHNLFFAQDLRKNLSQIFKDKTLPEDPSFYVHVPTVTDPSLAPAGKEILYILVPVPNLDGGSGNFSLFEKRIQDIVFERINATAGVKIQDLIEVRHAFYPSDFISYYNIKHGATFGLAHTLMQSAFFRPMNYETATKGLYYVGASTQPGGGLPVVIAGSRIVADLIHNQPAEGTGNKE
ncbi:MAG: phytoene desaturase family protein [Candidatus Omnitrophota bacterium]